MHKILLFLFTTILLPTSLTGQILNADEFGRRTPEAGAIQGELSLGVDVDKEDDIILEVNNQADISYRVKNSLFILAERIKLLRSGSESFVNSGFFHLRNRNAIHTGINPEIFAQYQWDVIRGLENRALGGANLRFRIQRDSVSTTHFAVGLMYEFERWSFTAVPRERRPPDAAPFNLKRVKVNSYLSYSRQFTETFQASFITYFQTEPDSDFDHPRMSVRAELVFKITTHVSFEVGYSHFYDSRPPVPIDKFYFSMSNGVSVKF